MRSPPRASTTYAARTRVRLPGCERASYFNHGWCCRARTGGLVARPARLHRLVRGASCLASMRVLIAEDERRLADAIARGLRREGIAVDPRARRLRGARKGARVSLRRRRPGPRPSRRARRRGVPGGARRAPRDGTPERTDWTRRCESAGHILMPGAPEPGEVLPFAWDQRGLYPAAKAARLSPTEALRA